MEDSPMVWRKSRRSNDQGGSCVELAALKEGIGVRDSRDHDGPHLTLDATSFRALLAHLKRQ